MALGGLWALLDDIATMLDDVSVMTQVAAKKTAGVLGDDLALNAQQITGVDASRELPVVWAVAKGSFINKLILVPAALGISYVASWLITPLLMLGGAFLCFEGVEKLAHKFLHKQEAETHDAEIKQAIEDPKADLAALEKEKIKGAIRTDFILSAEIIVIALGSAAASGASFAQQAAVVSAIAFVMTVGVYGLVAGIVKMDDVGLWMMLRKGSSIFKQITRKVGQWLLAIVPYLMRLLSFLGTAAMFLVGGAILTHGVPALHHWVEQFGLWSILLNGLIGIVAGAICLALFSAGQAVFKKK
jgi:predicted DNA repair protein MutK